ncbi:C45 family autoproteolytic acyltransferase/hydolase [Flammeovirga sp. EKP202]|uniref:C45 family autoproteolytic acyltransferase/hydolase n=1 Tax=Flammeovirga sp. EKP202 TaxID=2770592 RepID=UPI00165F6224|nr:C45 family autoproteolytic acyltransferase/hydolase [Flammeovirga sp. EKP202]MBD0404883.1 hypothetical protein [Flammeovirga sp. EKP202]
MNNINKIRLKVIAVLIAWFSIVILTLNVTVAGIPPVYYQIELNESSNYYVIEAEGSHYAVGYVHGKKFKKEIRYMLNRFKYELVEPMMMSVGLAPNYENYKSFCLHNTGMLEAIQKYTPQLHDEVKGIAEGSGLPLDDLLCFNISFDELFAVMEEMSGKNPALVEGNNLSGHCSAGAVWNDNKASVCYSLDWARMFEGAQCLMKYNVDGKVLLLTGYVGTVGIQGVHLENGFSLNAHSKFDLRANIEEGLPSVFFARSILESKSKEEACTKIEQLPIAVGIGYVLTDHSGSTIYELSGKKKVKVQNNNHFLAISNDIRVNDDLKESVKAHFNIKKVNVRKLPKAYWKNNKDSNTRYTMISNYLKGKTLEQVEWENVFGQYPVSKAVSKEIPVTNLWIIVDFDSEFINIKTAPSHPGGLPLEEYRVKYKNIL